MGYTLMAYAVSISDIEECVGCKEEDFANDAKFDLPYLDEDGDELRTRQAHKQMVSGSKPYNEQFKHKYGYVFELWCRDFGSEVDSNRHWTAMRIGWFDVVKEALKAVGIHHDGTCPGDVVFRGPPVDIPHADDFPAIGFVRFSEMKDILDALSEEKVSKIKDSDIRDAILEYKSWIARCNKPVLELDLMLFYY